MAGKLLSIIDEGGDGWGAALLGWGKGRNDREGGEVERDGELQSWAGGRGEMTGRE